MMIVEAKACGTHVRIVYMLRPATRYLAMERERLRRYLDFAFITDDDEVFAMLFFGSGAREDADQRSDRDIFRRNLPALYEYLYLFPESMTRSAASPGLREAWTT
jgi:hypothetical protein